MLKIIKNKEIKIGAAIFGAFFLFFIDHFLKIWALSALYNQRVTIIRKWFYFDLYKNENIAFSLPLPQFISFPIIIFIIGLLVYYLLKSIKKSFGLREIALIFIITGAFGNLIDRLRYGYVVDYINFRFWPVFNLSDILISVGTIILIVFLFRNRKK
ncbi:MAG: signal peptidase II [Patescibacteria group bacterium]|jgi:signal peptidase II